jgi:hypothetical protein
MTDLHLFDVDPSPEFFPEAVSRLLFERDDWPERLALWLRSLSPKELLALAEANPEPLDIQPRSLCIASTPTTTVVLNWFDVAEYVRLAKLGRQTPHRHQFDFGARVLAGGYVQWLFVNDGDLENPQLSFGRQMTCRVGDGYHLAHDGFHHVFAPDHGTITLMIRSPVRRAAQRSIRTLDQQQLVVECETLATILSTLPRLPTGTPSDVSV